MKITPFFDNSKNFVRIIEVLSSSSTQTAAASRKKYIIQEYYICDCSIMVYIVAAAADLNAAWEWFRGVVDKYLVREIIATIPLFPSTACIAFLNANHLETLHQCGIFLDWNLFLGVSATILGLSAEHSHTRWASIIFVYVLLWYPRSSPAVVSH